MKHFIPLLFLLLCSCKQEFVDVPKDIMPMGKMKTVLMEIHIADALAETKAQAGEDEKTLTRKYHEQIYKNHAITHAEFMTSYKFYEANPKLMNKMYDEILNDLSKREETEGKKK